MKIRIIFFIFLSLFPRIAFSEEYAKTRITPIDIHELEEKYNCLCNAVRQSLCAEIKCAQEDIDLTKDCDIFEISHMALKPIIVIYYWHQIGLFGGADYICVCIPDEEAGFQDIRVYPCYWRELKEIFPGMYKDDMPEYEGCEF